MPARSWQQCRETDLVYHQCPPGRTGEEGASCRPAVAQLNPVAHHRPPASRHSAPSGATSQMSQFFTRMGVILMCEHFTQSLAYSGHSICAPQMNEKERRKEGRNNTALGTLKSYINSFILSSTQESFYS
jgi:hypothetical protein